MAFHPEGAPFCGSLRLAGEIFLDLYGVLLEVMHIRETLLHCAWNVLHF